MRVLLTGAFGNLGASTLSVLLEKGHKVRCFDVASKTAKKKAKSFEGRVEIVWGDIRNPDIVEKAVENQEAVIHNAAVIPPVTERKKELAWAINVDGTRNIIDASKKSAIKPVIIFSSSVSIYGPNKNRKPPLKADDPVIATDQYTTHKIECEKMLKESGIPWIILRVGVALDPDARDADADSFKTIFDVLPETRLEYVHPLDVAVAQANAVSCKEAIGKVLLIGGGESCRVTYKDLFGAVFDAIGMRNMPAEAFGTEPFYTDWMDTEESQRLLNYQMRSFDKYKHELHYSMRFIRYSLLLFRPIVKRVILSFSTPWKTRKS